jgi:solute carrier family 35 (GDP-fucose transporter), member C1
MAAILAQMSQKFAVLFAVSFYLVTRYLLRIHIVIYIILNTSYMDIIVCGGSITMVLANKWVLRVVDSAPLFFLWIQIVIAVVLMTVCQYFNLIHFTKPSAAGSMQFMPALNINKSRRLWRLIAVNVIGLTFNTYCLAYIDASIYQVARSLILPLTVIMQFVILNEKSSPSIIVSCAIVCSGFLVGLFMDSHDNGVNSSQSATSVIDLRGILFGVLSSFTTAYHSIVIKRSLDVCEGNTLELVWYNNALSAIALLPLIVLTGEVNGFSYWLYDSYNDSHAMFVFLVGSLLTGFFGFLINLAGFLQIKITSPVTHMISSAVRGVLQTILAVWFFHDILTTSRVTGIVLILLGSSLYTWFKASASHQHSQHQHQTATNSTNANGYTAYSHSAPASTVSSPTGELKRAIPI